MPNKYTTPDEARTTLKRLGVKPGTTIYTLCRRVSTSGMSRVIDLFVIHKNQPVSIAWCAAALMSYSLDSHSNGYGLKVSGAGMDMGFHVVYSLGSVLWPKGTPKPHGTRNGEPDQDGGYALRQRWL